LRECASSLAQLGRCAVAGQSSCLSGCLSVPKHDVASLSFERTT